jgi:toxin-antitoxin system PIN domain toxin
MIVPDINLLVVAYSAGAPEHGRAKAWWTGLMNGPDPVGIPWAVSCGFIRLMTHPSVLVTPMEPGVAVSHVRSWLERPHVEPLEPGPRHLAILERLVTKAGVAATLTTDAHVAAIALEHQCEVHSNDADFSRFEGLRWHNPLAQD